MPPLKGLDVGLGVIAGLVTFYVLSLASALWVAQFNPSDYIWSMILSAAICSCLGALVSWRPGASAIASLAMLILFLISLTTGSDEFVWVAPLPADVVSLFFHGSRTPLVIGPTILIGVAGITRILAVGRQQALKSLSNSDSPPQAATRARSD